MPDEVTTSPTSSERSMAFQPPVLEEFIGPYQIDARIGGGGMGLVFRAKDTRLGRHVAIKIIRPETLSSTTRAAFLREAQMASSLNHPGIVTIHDLLTHREMECIVMEFIDGVSLSSMISKQAISPSTAARIVTEIGQALNAAHRAGVIHRDLKPGNVMVASDGRIKIVDFGLSFAKRGLDEATGSMSIFSGVVGTLAYMAPEHAEGKAVDHRADIFALTIILHELLTGLLPFSAPNPAALLRALLWGKPSLPSTVRRELAAFDAVVERGLRKEPENRYQSVDEMLVDVAHARSNFESGKVVSGESVRAFQAVERASAISSAFSSSLSGPPTIGSERASIAVLPFNSLSRDPEDSYLAAGLASELVSALTGLNGLRIAPQVAAYREHERGADPIAVSRTLNTRYVLTGSLRRGGDRIRVGAELTDGVAEAVVWTKSYDRLGEDIFEIQEDIARLIVKSVGGHLIRAATDFAFHTPTDNLDAWGLLRKAYHIWNYQFSVEGVRTAIDLSRRAVALDPDYSSALANLSTYLIQSVIHSISTAPEADRAESMAAADRAIELAPQDPEVLAAASIVLIHTGQYERAVVNLRRAVRVAPYDLVPWGYLAFAHACAGERAQLEECSRVLRHLIADAPDHPSLAYWHQFLAIASLRTEDFETAIESAGKAVELQPGFVFNQVFLGEALCRVQRQEEARQVVASIRLYNPAFTMSAFEHVALACSRNQEYVEQLCANVRALKILE
jgi:serine/threonine protein kinase